MKRRILHIIPSLDQSGAEKQLVLLATALPADEFDVSVCALTRGGPWLDVLHERGIPTTVIGKKHKLDPWAYGRLKRHIRQTAPHLVHTWMFAANSYGRLAARQAGITRIIAAERCADPWKHWYQLQLDRWLARFTNVIVVNSEGVLDFYQKSGLPSERFRLIPNGVVTNDGQPQITREEFIRGLGIPDGARLIGVIGRLWPQKRVHDLIWAADLLKSVRTDAHVLIVGDGPERARLERFRDRLQVADRVHFLGHRADLSAWLPCLDCIWLASGYEGQSNAVMEAMMARVPVIVTDIPGNRELIQHEVTGFLVPVGNRARFVQHTLTLFQDGECAHRIGAAARQRMIEHFSVTDMVQRYVNVYHEVLAYG